MSMPTPPLTGHSAPEGDGKAALAGVLLMLLAMTMIPVMDSFAKLLTERFHTVQIVWGRYFFHLMIFMPIAVLRYGSATFRPAQPGLQILRGGFLLCSTALFFAALALMPLADALATVFVYPFVITALSPLVLGEAVGPRRWVAVSIGFLGAMIIVRPGGGVIESGALFALGAGTTYACYVLATRKLAGSAPALVTLTFTGLLGAVVTTALVPLVWVQPTLTEWCLMIGTGLIAAIGHLLLIMAHERATASSLAPFGYFEIVSATLLGLMIFGDFPDAWTWLGITVVVASGVYIWLRESRHGAIAPK